MRCLVSNESTNVVESTDGVFVTAPDGTRWPVFVGCYTHDGKPYCLDIPARDWDDARTRIEAIRESFEVLGPLGGVIECDDEEARRITTMFGDRA
jgi:hypothetical protein